MRRLEHDGRRDARLERFLPASSDDAPAVSRPKPGEHPLRLRRDEIVPADTENSRNSSVITAQTAWKPGSTPSVRQ